MGSKGLKEQKIYSFAMVHFTLAVHTYSHHLRGLPNKSTKNWQIKHLLAFSPVTGGNYNGGTLNNTGNGNWWSTNANGGTNRWNLKYNGSYLYTKYNSRVNGFYVRCVKS